MADLAARHGPVAVCLDRGTRMPMALEAKSMKPRLGSLAKIRAMAAMTFDAQRGARSVGIVVVAGEAIDRAVLVVREIEGQTGSRGETAARAMTRRREAGTRAANPAAQIIATYPR